MPRLTSPALALVSALAALTCTSTAIAATGDVSLVSKNAAGVSGNGASTSADVSADGQVVAFLSAATNVTTVPSGVIEAYVRNTATNTTTLVSRNNTNDPANSPANHDVTQVATSDDGLVTAFVTTATNLGPSTQTSHVFVRHDNVTQYLGEGSDPDVSGNGKFVVWATNAAIGADTGSQSKIAIEAVGPATGTTPSQPLLVTAPGSANASSPSISTDGTDVAFLQFDSDNGNQVFLADRLASTRTLVSRASDTATGSGAEANLPSDQPKLSANGRFVVFRTRSQLTDTPTDSEVSEAYERDVSSGTTYLVSRAAGLSGAPAADSAFSPSVSNDGRRVSFLSNADNLSATDNNATENIYVRDPLVGTLQVVTGSPAVPAPSQDVSSTSMSANGQFLGFDSTATLLPAQETGAFPDVYLRDLGPAPAAPTASISNAGPVVEGNPTDNPGSFATFTITLNTPLASAVSVAYRTFGGTATPGTDFAAVFTSVTFAPGETVKTVAIPIVGDTIPEPDETFTVGIDSDDVDALATGGQATILDDDPIPAVTVGDAPAVSEGNAGPTNVTFPVTLSAAVQHAVSFTWATVDGTATTADGDYIAGSGTVTIPAGSTTGSIVVSVNGDTAVEADESFTVHVSGANRATFTRFDATATIVNDDAVARPTPEHTLLGSISAQPAFAPGVPGLSGVGPFAFPAFGKLRIDGGPLEVSLVDRGGSVVTRSAAIVPPSPAVQDAEAPVPYRFDNLGACDACSVQLSSRSVLQDSQPVSFDASPGQTQVDLVDGRFPGGGTLEGTIQAPGFAPVKDKVVGGTKEPIAPQALVVRVLGVNKQVLATTAQIVPQCGAGVKNEIALRCASSASYAYRLRGLPPGAADVTVDLQQRSGKNLVSVDSAAITLSSDGVTEAPDLTALDAVPASTSAGRVIFGSIAHLAPFAPGTASAAAADLKGITGVAKASTQLRVSLLDGKSVKASVIVDVLKLHAGAPDYTLRGVPPCTGCVLEIADGKKKFTSPPFDVPDLPAVVIHHDLADHGGAQGEFAEGAVDTTEQPTAVSVRIVDALTNRTLADTASLGHKCVPGCAAGEWPYRLGGLPADRKVIAQLVVSGKSVVDTESLTTAGAGEVTNIPTLAQPIGRLAGRVVQGTILLTGPHGVGLAPALPKTRTLRVVLLDRSGYPVGPVTAVTLGAEKKAPTANNLGSYGFAVSRGCSGCTIQLSDGSTVEDRVPVTVPDAPVSVTLAPVTYGKIAGGGYVTGTLKLAGKSIPAGLRVTIVAAGGKVLADTDLLPRPCVKQESCQSAAEFDYQLGGIAADAGQLTVVVNGPNGKSKSAKLASTTVAAPPVGGSVAAQDLKIAFPSAAGNGKGKA